MSEHIAVVEWRRVDGERFIDSRYFRRHAVSFDGGGFGRALRVATRRPGALFRSCRCRP